MVKYLLLDKFQKENPAQHYRINLDYVIVYAFLAVHQLWQVSDESPRSSDFFCNNFIIRSIDNSTVRLSKHK